MVLKPNAVVDIAKPGPQLQNLTGMWNARVLDGFTPFVVQFKENGLPVNLTGLNAFIEGDIGEGHYDSATDDIVMTGTPKSVRYTDDGSGNTNMGIVVFRLPPQFFIQTGIFKGFIGLQSSTGIRSTSNDVWFKVFGSSYTMGISCKYFISDFQKALDQANGKIDQALKKFNDDNEKFTQNMRDNLDALNGQIQANRDEQANLNNHLISTDQKIAAGDVVTWTTYNADQQKTTDLVKSQLSQITQIPETFKNLDDLKATYPSGKNGIFVTMDTKHAYIWDKDQWEDNGPYITNALPRSITESCPINYMQIPLTKKMDNAYYDGQLKTNVVAGGAVYEPVNIKPRSNYRIITKLGGQANIVLQDNNGNIKTFGNNPDSSTVYDIYTDDFTKLYICTLDNSTVGNYPRLYGVSDQVADNSNYEKDGFQYQLDNGLIKTTKTKDSKYVITEMLKPDEVLDAKVASIGSNWVGLVFCDNDGNIVDYKQKIFKEIFTTQDFKSDKSFSYISFSGYDPQFTLRQGAFHRGFPVTSSNCSNYLKHGYNYNLVNGQVKAVKENDVNYEISEMFKPDEISQLSYASSGGKDVWLLFLDSNGRLVDYKQKQNFTSDDLTSKKSFSYVSFGGYDFTFILKGNPQHRGYPDLSHRFATVVLEFDNEESDFYKSRFDLLKQYGFPFSFAIESTFRTDGFTNEANYKNYQDMINFGCDPMIYGGIGPDPNSATATEADWHTYVDDWLNWCDEHGLYCPVYACSLNELPQNLINVLKSRGFKYARTDPYWANNAKDIDLSMFQLPTLALDNTENSLDNLKADIQNAIDNGKTVSVLSHLIGGTKDFQVSTETYTLFLKWLKDKVDSGQVKVTTYSGLLSDNPAMADVETKRASFAYSHTPAWPWTEEPYNGK